MMLLLSDHKERLPVPSGPVVDLGFFSVTFLLLTASKVGEPAVRHLETASASSKMA
jgi:hypothetical protein